MPKSRTGRKIAAPLLFLASALACASSPSSIDKGPLVPFAPEGITAAGRPKRIALLIGIDRFEDPRFTPLEFAAADARALAEAIEGFDEIRVLATEGETSRAAIFEALQQLTTRAASASDTVMVYLSSHGSLGRRPGGELERFLVARDTRLDLIARTGIAVNELVAAVEQIPARSKVLFLAACHSGAGKSRLPDEVASVLRGTKAPLEPLDRVSEATLLFTAAAFGEAAKESRELGHDVYTHFLLQALKSGDADGDGAITATEAHDYARRRTYLFTSGAQRPTAEVSILGEDPIVLSGKRLRDPLPVIYSYAGPAEGLLLRVDGQDKGSLPGGVAVGAGGHQIELLDGDRVLYRGSFSLAHGDRIELSKLMPSPPRLGIALVPSLFVPLDGGGRALIAPISYGAGALLGVEHALFEGSLLGLELSARAGRGSAEGFEERLPFAFTAFGGALHLGAVAELPERFRLQATLDLGVHWWRRSFETDSFRSTQSAAAFTTGAAAELIWSGPVELGLRAGAGAFFVALSGETDPHPYFELALRVGASFSAGDRR